MSHGGDKRAAFGIVSAARCTRSPVPTLRTEAKTPWRAAEGFTAQCVLTNPFGFTFLPLKRRLQISVQPLCLLVTMAHIPLATRKNNKENNNSCHCYNNWLRSAFYSEITAHSADICEFKNMAKPIFIAVFKLSLMRWGSKKL